jgi:hypothetical protein
MSSVNIFHLREVVDDSRVFLESQSYERCRKDG